MSTDKPASADPLIGRTLGEFTIQERIGRGGMATVYRAYQDRMKRDVALKVLDMDGADVDASFESRFAHEVKVIASLDHLHIVPVHAYGIQDNIAYLAMRLMRGGSLHERLEGGEILQLKDTARIFEQIAGALAFAHSRGVIHRDIKPGNIMLDGSGNAYLTDFGLAKLLNSTENITQSGSIMGTLTYMSPEQLRGEPLDHRSDIYSMGILLYHMLCGSPPFGGEPDSDMVSILYKHLEETPPSMRQFQPDLLPELEAAVLKALAKGPANRYRSMGEMAAAVLRATGDSQIVISYPEVDPTLLPSAETSATAPTTTITSLQTDITRRRTLLGLGVALVLLVILISGGLLLSSGIIAPPLPRHRVIADERINWDELAPDEDILSRAQRRLGDDGFVAIMACNTSSEYHATFTREMTDRARENGLAFRVYDSNSDSYEQRLDLEQALIDDATGFILCPLDLDLLTDPLSDIEARGMPLVMTTSTEMTYGGAQTSNVQDDYFMGLTAGRYAGQLIDRQFDGQARVILLDFPDLESIVERANGLGDGILELAPEAEIISRERGATREFAYDSIHRLLDEGVSFDLIASINDAGSYGAIDALQEAGIGPDEVFIVSVDAEQRALQYIEQNYYIRGSLTVGREATAVGAVDMITRMLAGLAVPQTIIIPPGEMITREMILAGRG